MAASKPTYYIVIFLPPFQLIYFLGTLINDLGCYPLDPEPYRSKSVLSLYLIGIQSLYKFSQDLLPLLIQCFTPNKYLREFY